jgi:threonylcarbamoyladenosine tRNA methylthiotransferase MtaB
VRRAKRTNPEAKVVVTGCAAQMELNAEPSYRMEASLTADADLLVPNPEKLLTIERFFGKFPEYLPTGPKRQAIPTGPLGRTRATLKVQDGCNVHCSYCSIPYTRPGMVSRPWNEVLAEAQELASKGFQEAVLTGVLIGAYGPESGSGGPGFEELVTLLAERSGLARLRISSIEMHQVTQPIVDLAKSGHIVPHFHIPLQSGDDQVLEDMNRRYRQADFLGLCARLYHEVPDVSLTTDVMVGFPTETPERFASSVKVLEEARFLKAHVFRFSPRPGTPADQWGDPVSAPEKQDRAKRLTEISERTAREHVRRFVGRTMKVLIEGKIGRDGLLEGLTENWISVKLVGSPELARTIQWVRLDEERGGLAHGELQQEPSQEGLLLTAAL